MADDVAPAAVEAAVEAHATLDTPPVLATYHVAMWDEPIAYVCLVCPPPAPHLPLEEVQRHIPEAHGVPAIPTETTPFLIQLRADADAQDAANQAALAAAQALQHTLAATATITPTPAPEERADGRGDDHPAPADV